MPAWTLWLILAAILVLPVLLRIYAGDEPRNEVTQEQPGQDDEAPDRDPGPVLLRAAA